MTGVTKIADTFKGVETCIQWLSITGGDILQASQSPLYVGSSVTSPSVVQASGKVRCSEIVSGDQQG
jgi:hypothetical protein